MLRKNEQGFTMLELITAIGIFAIVIPALALGVRSLIVLNNRARDLSLVSLVAENKTEQLRSSGFNSLDEGTTDFSAELPSELSRPNSASYTITNPEDGIKEVTVTISYWDYSTSKTKTYKTIVSELGVGQ